MTTLALHHSSTALDACPYGSSSAQLSSGTTMPAWASQAAHELQLLPLALHVLRETKHVGARLEPPQKLLACLAHQTRA